MRRYLFLVFLALCCAACTGRRSASEPAHFADKKPFTIYLQPYEYFPQREADALRASITQALGRVYRCDWSHVEVLPSCPLPAHAYYEPRQRYLASALLRDLSVAGPDAFVIGLTHKDISFNIHNTKNYGIMGLTTRGHFKTIVSDYRAKGDNFLAVIVHEFGHGYYKAPHCTDPTCIMCDYQAHKGKPFVYGLYSAHQYMHYPPPPHHYLFPLSAPGGRCRKGDCVFPSPPLPLSPCSSPSLARNGSNEPSCLLSCASVSYVTSPRVN